jgi:hypothetical protein
MCIRDSVERRSIAHTIVFNNLKSLKFKYYICSA